MIISVSMLPENAPSGLCVALRGILYFRPRIFVYIDCGHGIKLDQVPESQRLQDRTGTSAAVSPFALDLPAACQVRVPLRKATILLPWLHFGSRFG